MSIKLTIRDHMIVLTTGNASIYLDTLTPFEADVLATELRKAAEAARGPLSIRKLGQFHTK